MSQHNTNATFDSADINDIADHIFSHPNRGPILDKVLAQDHQKGTAILDAAGAEYETVTLSQSKEYTADAEEMSPPGLYDKGPSDANLTVVDWGKIPWGNDDEIRVTFSFELEGGTDLLISDKPGPDDGVAIAWKNDVFDYKPNSINAVARIVDPVVGDTREIDLKVKDYPVIGDNSNGVAGALDDSRGYSPAGPLQIKGSLGVDLRKTADKPGAILAKYIHTWSLYNTELNIFESFSISTKGLGISLSLPTGVDTWKIVEEAEV